MGRKASVNRIRRSKNVPDLSSSNTDEEDVTTESEPVSISGPQDILRLRKPYGSKAGKNLTYHLDEDVLDEAKRLELMIPRDEVFKILKENKYDPSRFLEGLPLYRTVVGDTSYVLLNELPGESRRIVEKEVQKKGKEVDPFISRVDLEHMLLDATPASGIGKAALYQTITRAIREFEQGELVRINDETCQNGYLRETVTKLLPQIKDRIDEFA